MKDSILSTLPDPTASGLDTVVCLPIKGGPDIKRIEVGATVNFQVKYKVNDNDSEIPQNQAVACPLYTGPFHNLDIPVQITTTRTDDHILYATGNIPKEAAPSIQCCSPRKLWSSLKPLQALTLMFDTRNGSGSIELLPA